MTGWTPSDEGGWRPDDDDDERVADDETPGPVEIRVVTPTPIPLRIEPVERDEVREGERAFATYVDAEGAPTRPIAVNSLPTELLESLLVSGIFDRPRHLMASVHEEEGGLRGLLAALVPADEVERWARRHEEEGESEPWRASVPEAPSFELDTPEAQNDAQHAIAVVPIPLGVIVRFAENRRHPDDVVQEAADLVASVLGGYGTDAKEKKIDNLLDGL
jgi:hypothetical protein